MTQEEIKQLHITAFDEVMKEKLVPIIGAEVASSVQKTVANLKLQRETFGKDITGLSESQKKSFAKVAQSVLRGKFDIDTKANEALIEEQDNRGGYLVSREIADSILRIAASVGTVLNQATKWDMTSDELAIPNYTGTFLTGAFLGVDAPGTVTGLTFGQTQLVVKKWQLAFVVGNDLLADASVNIADWLLALGGEALANYVDYQAFVGGANTGDPTIGLLNQPTSTTIQPNGQQINKVWLGGSSTSGKTDFSDYAVIDDSSNLIAGIEELILPDCAFYMNRSLWNKVVTDKDTAGNYVLPYAGWAKVEPMMEDVKGGGPIKPAGYIRGYPLAYPYTQSTLTVTLAGVGQSIGTDQQTDPTTVEVLYNDSGRFLRFTSDPGSGNQIIVQGEAQIPILAHVSDPTSIAAYGEFQDAISDSTILSIQEAQERAQADIDMFGDPVYTVKFNTISPLANQLFIGQQITLNSAKFGVSGKALIIKQINCVARTPFQLEYQVQCLGSDSVTFNDIMLTLLQQNLGQTTTPDSTVLQDLIPVEEELELSDAVTVNSATLPAVWGPVATALQSAEGGAMYGSFSYGSFALGGGLPYADDAPSTSPAPVIRWGFFTWRH